jgi:hypothetical protein
MQAVPVFLTIWSQSADVPAAAQYILGAIREIFNLSLSTINGPPVLLVSAPITTPSRQHTPTIVVPVLVNSGSFNKFFSPLRSPRCCSTFIMTSGGSLSILELEEQCPSRQRPTNTAHHGSLHSLILTCACTHTTHTHTHTHTHTNQKQIQKSR